MGGIMRSAFRMMSLASVLAIGGLAVGTSSARAQGFGYGGYPGTYYGSGAYYGAGSYYGSGGYYGGGYGIPSFNYYGNGGHDLQPHWHTTQTPFGSFGWYGNGA